MMTELFGNPSSLHSLGDEAISKLKTARVRIAQMLACKTEKIIFTSGGTESNNLAILGGTAANRTTGSCIVTTSIEHSSVLSAFRHLEKEGFSAAYISPNRRSFRMNADDIIKSIDENTSLVSFMLVNNETGEILPAREIIQGIRKKNPGTLIHMDCVQAFGKIPVKIHEYDADFISASSHKIHGPKGAGVLYVKNRNTLHPRIYGGAQESGIRPGTENVPAICAFGKAANLALYEMKKNYDHVTGLRLHLLERLKEIRGIHINSPENRVLPHIVNFSVQGKMSDDLVGFMSLNSVYISAGSACSRGAESHVISALWDDDRIVKSAVRVSFCKDNSLKEIDIFMDLLKQYIA